MAQDQSLQRQEFFRPLDPDVKQRQASNPQDSVWVSASAGTGKTKVLTDRVLRLLLPPAEGVSGTPPHKILCLTYTKAAASEMELRISKALSRWSILPEGHEEAPKTLRHALKDLLGRPAKPFEIKAARQLFAAVVDHPGGLPIMTIHAFCQSLLGRFPLEAGLVPGFKALEEEAAGLLEQARFRVMARARRDLGSPLAGALSGLARILTEEQFFNLLGDIQSERRQFARMLHDYFGVEGVYTALCAFLEIPAGWGRSEILSAALEESAFDKVGLEQAALVMGREGTEKRDQPKAVFLRGWLDQDIAGRVAGFERYQALYFTTTGERRKDIVTPNLAKKYPDIEAVMAQEAARLEGVFDRLNKAHCAVLTRDLFLLADAIAAEYKALKARQGALDFDDLILKTLELLRGGIHAGLTDMPGWVNYKLDQGLDHLLVDEAQDTNPEQWEILEALTQEFFAGDGLPREGLERSVFVVGDHKQSIYSFQRASPREFARMKAFFAQKLSDIGRNLEPVELSVSFRSTSAVLSLVDSVFLALENRKGLGLEAIRHDSYRPHQAGLVELWPLYETPKREKIDFWSLPEATGSEQTGPMRLAGRVAETIASWLEKGEILPSRGRAIRPGDIMILLKSRKTAGPLMHLLKQKGIPVGGADRMILNDQLAVEDLLAGASFALLPQDDLALACFLKSPLVGMSEEALFDLAHDRNASLWQAVQDKASPDLAKWLGCLTERAGAQGPYAFFSHILNTPCPANERSGLAAIQARLGGHARDPLEELLEAAMTFESQNTPSLQLFLAWQLKQETEIRREMEGASSEDGPGFVRIMTVHGSKGLQAPIVILPDTVRVAKSFSTQNHRRLLWPHQIGLDLPLWSPGRESDFSLYRQAMERLEEGEDEEYRRLLYVALTRAEDRLYIGGASGGKPAIPDSWYHMVAKGFDALEGVETLEDGTRRFTNPQNAAPDKPAKPSRPAEEDIILPDWLFVAPTPETPSSRPLIPSRPSLPDPASRSPLDGVRTGHIFVRGNLTHKLLQFLPDLTPDRREYAGRRYLEHAGALFDPPEQATILREVMSVLDHPEFSTLFGPGSMAEVPISGLSEDGTLISGQIDRLLVRADKILIVDYKTNRNPPAHPRDIPPAYTAQMRSYAALLRLIYPGRPIAGALIWTDGPVLMPVDLGSEGVDASGE